MSDCVRLSQKQRAAVLALLTCGTVEAAAEQAGCSPRSINRWMREAAFTEALHRAERDAIGQATRRLCGLAGAAVDTLERIMANPKASASTRTRAAACVLDSILKLRSALDWEERIADLEARLQ